MLLSRLLPLFFLVHFSAFASAPSGETWLTLQTPNFRVHHTAALEVYARAFAKALERGLPLLEKDMRWEVRHKPIDIVVMDPSDSANGLAVSFPNTHIEVYATAFESDTTLAHYVNWVNELATHELTHIVANDETRGFYSALRFLFGSWVKPNGLEPTWLSEGLAVYEETAHTTGGRGRSPLLEAMLRTAIREDVLNSGGYTSLDRFNDGAPWWPAGNTAYLMGYAIQALPSQKNPGLPGSVAFENANNLPFFPNDALEEVTGRNWYSVWGQAPARLQQRYGKPAPLSPLCRLTGSGAFTGGHALSADGWVYFSEQDWNHGQHFARVRADAPCGEAKVERLYRKDKAGPTQVAVSPGGKLAAFAAFDRQGFDRFYSDIYVWNAGTGGTERLTDGGRGRDPVFGDDETLFYVRAKENTNDAVIRRDLRTGREQEVYVGRPLERISGLNARGETVLFSLHDNAGQERIYSLDLRAGKAGRAFPSVEAGRAFERNPHLAADGSIYFAAAYENSTQDLYRYDPQTKKIRRIAEGETGYLDRPVPLPDGRGLLYQAYGLNGLDLVRGEVKEAPAVVRSASQDLHGFLTGEKPRAVELPPEEYPAVPYNALTTPATPLWPQYWLPDVVAARDGALIGASTTGNDPLDYHKYGLTMQYDTRASFPSYLAYYLNRVNVVNLLVQANQFNDYFPGSQTSNRSALYSAQAIMPIGKAAYSLGSAFQDRSLFGVKGQNTIVFQNFNHTEAGATAAAIGPNFGHAVNLYLGLFPRARNEDFFVDARPSVALYSRGFHPAHSVSIAASAGISTNSILASNYYQGGGASPLSASPYTVRGYPTDVLFGQRIATANLAYTIPLAHPYRGFGTAPLFIENLGLRLLGDAGSASYLGVYSDGYFRGRVPKKFMRAGIAGAGADLVLQGSVFYHVPVSLSSGLHYGFRKRYGGELIYFLGLSLGALGPALGSAR